MSWLSLLFAQQPQPSSTTVPKGQGPLTKPGTSPAAAQSRRIQGLILNAANDNVTDKCGSASFRILVVKKADEKWYVYPTPQYVELMSAGLNSESDSTQDFLEAYEVQK